VENDNVAITRHKVKAYIMYDKFMVNLFDSVKTDGSLKERTTLERIKNLHRHRLGGKLTYYCKKLPVNDFVSFMREYRSRGYLQSTYVTLKKWLFYKIGITH